MPSITSVGLTLCSPLGTDTNCLIFLAHLGDGIHPFLKTIQNSVCDKVYLPGL